MFTLKELQDWNTQTKKQTPRGFWEWFPARPLIAPFEMRLKDAWAVLTGKADAFTWPEGQ